LAVALSLVPMLSAQIAKVRFTSRLGETRPFVAFDRAIGAARRGYGRVAEKGLHHRWWLLGGSVAALAVAFLLTRNLGSEFLPQVDDGGVGAFIRLPAGRTPEQTNAVALELEEMVRAMPHVEHVFTTAGGFLFGGATADRSGRGSMDIRLSSAAERDMTADEWVTELQRRVDERGFPGARVFIRPPRIRGLRTSSSGSDVAITIQGDDLVVLQRIGEELAQRLQGIPGLENMEPSVDEPSPQLAVRLDRDRAGYLGLSVAEVGQTLRTALDGTIATRYAEGNREYDVRVRLPRGRFVDPSDLGNIALFPGASGGAPIYLRDVADVSTTLGPSEIDRENQNRILRVSGDVITDVASVGEVNDSIEARIAGVELPDGYGIIMGGEEEAIQENNRQLLIVALLAVFLVFVVMALQYESLLNPLVILLAIPLSLIGVGFALWITGTPLSAPVLLGVILLAGIVVNNAILLVEYVEEYRHEGGLAIEAAVVRAGMVRLRPILMTTLTTILGMFPLAMGIGEGSELMQPLAIAVVGGLTVSTLLTLFVVPSAYLVAHDLGDRLGAWLTGRKRVSREAASPEPVPAEASR
ncbi:MAG: efflux RND transporter permease subunit, partial [Gemmatimonadota bacterium]|nr:efflux RND transporter permease subunit [Gemmatimonadota bacterium]